MQRRSGSSVADGFSGMYAYRRGLSNGLPSSSCSPIACSKAGRLARRRGMPAGCASVPPCNSRKGSREFSLAMNETKKSR